MPELAVARFRQRNPDKQHSHRGGILMAGPATKFGSTTGHGGTVIGPGCPTVLINNVPAIRVGPDMHLCPMVTPGTPPIPHLGMNCIGPGVPTVLIGKMPASTLGDNFLCVGPPAPVLTGAFNVLIGTGAGGGGGGGGGGAGASDASTAQALQAGTITPVEGTEAFPVDIQAVLLDARPYMSREAMDKQIRIISDALSQVGEQEEPVDLTIADLVEILKAVESEEGYEAARFFASHLDYGVVTDLARGYVSGENTDSNNDPNLMPTRFMLLFGMDDKKLKEIGDHPDRSEGEEHKITVTNLRKGLRLLGYEVTEDGPYDDEVYRAHVWYMVSVAEGMSGGGEQHIVEDGQDLGEIAYLYRLPSWKYLYELNKDVIGENPDLLSPGTVLHIPQWDTTCGDEKITAKGFRPFSYTGGLRYRYPWTVFSLSLVDDTGSLMPAFEEKREIAIFDETDGRILLRGETDGGDTFSALVPDCSSMSFGIKGVIMETDSVPRTWPEGDNPDEAEANVK